MKVYTIFLLLLILISCEDPLTHNSNNNESKDSKPTNKTNQTASQDSAVYYIDHIQPLFKKSCLPCHGEGNKRNWMDYQTTMDHAQDILGSVNHESNYRHMPIGRVKLDASKILLIEKWVEQGMLEKSKYIHVPDTKIDESTIESDPLDDPKKIGEGLYKSNCAACHDMNQIYPGLKGQNKEYIKLQLEDFKTGYRANSVMSFYANEVINDTKSIEFIADYLSELKPCYAKTKKTEIRLLAEDKAPDLAKGKVLYEARCKVCHTRGNSLDNPNIEGLNAKYLVKVLSEFKGSFRPSTSMVQLMQNYSRQDILDISGYVSQQNECE